MNKTLFYNFQLVDPEFKSQQSQSVMWVDRGRIQWLGSKKDFNRARKSLSLPKNLKEVNLNNQIVFPSFIECHTHMMFAGSRADEFEKRLNGVSYLDIAKAGGGILSTMRKTRQAKPSDLIQSAQDRLTQFLNQGVSTVEIKSGYALDLKNEIKLLQSVQHLQKMNEKTGVRLVPTFLGAHARPPEFSTDQEYLIFLAEKVLPIVARKKLSKRVDIFIEKNFFELPWSQTFMCAAKDLGFDLTIHANQLSLSGGADLALDLQALSADHVIHLTDELVQRFAKSKTVAVLLPTADLYMRCAYPRARSLIDAGATVALATDFNPGSCPSQDISLVGLLARLEMKMTLPEVFKAYTSGAAQALGLLHEEGELKVGKLANFISTHAELSDFFYSAGRVPDHQLFIRGKLYKSQ